MQYVFETEGIPPYIWLWLILCGIILSFVVEIEKGIIRAMSSRNASLDAALSA